jgi:signal peptide peptidase SppA
MNDNEMLPPLTLGRSLWAIRPDVLPRLVEAHRRHKTLESLGVRVAAPDATRRSTSDRPGGTVAMLPLTGIITPRGSLLSMLFGGGGGLQEFRDNFRAAVADPDVGAIVLDVDSPGGLVDLVPETAAEVFAARGAKPIVAVANTMAASAAYFIAAQADELVVTPSGDVGSIGVYMLHEDWSKFNEQVGIAPTYISAGKYKTEGNPDEPLSDEAEAIWQEDVDDLYAMFVEAVAQGRGVSAEAVRSGYGEGRTLLAERALAAGMVDRIATLEMVVGELLVQGAQRAAGASALATQNRGSISLSDGVTTYWLFPNSQAEAPTPSPPEPQDDPVVKPPVTDPPADVPEPNPDVEVPEPDVAEPAPAPEAPEPDVAEPVPAPEVPEPDALERADLELDLTA